MGRSLKKLLELLDNVGEGVFGSVLVAGTVETRERHGNLCRDWERDHDRGVWRRDRIWSGLGNVNGREWIKERFRQRRP
jgi:hypothetical protein